MIHEARMPLDQRAEEYANSRGFFKGNNFYQTIYDTFFAAWEMREANDMIVPTDHTQDLIEQIIAKRDSVLEQFAEAFLAETGATAPSECELCEEVQHTEQGTLRYVWYFRKKRETPPNPEVRRRPAIPPHGPAT